MWVECPSMSLISEFKRRNVSRAPTAYVVTSWLIIQVVETIFLVYGLSDNAIRMVITLLATAFTPTLVFFWVLELTPKGFRREVADVHRIPVSGPVDKKLDRLN